jgi:hypothetical protein
VERRVVAEIVKIEWVGCEVGLFTKGQHPVSSLESKGIDSP